MKPLMRRKLCTIAETLVLLKRLTDQRNLTDHHTKIPKKLGKFTIMTKVHWSGASGPEVC